MIDELTQIADRELHLARGRIPNGVWQIPVFVDFYRSNKKEYAKITPAVGLSSEQAGWLYYTFSLHNCWKKRDVFLIERHFLEQFAEKAPGITPEYYFRWPGVVAPQSNRKRLKIAEADMDGCEFSEDTEDFIEFVRTRRCVDANVLRLAIDLIAREAVYWLTQKKRPIDLGFVKIHAVPYRANWKEILLARFRDIAWVFSSNKETKENALRQTKFYEHLCTLELMAIDSYKRYIHWTIEAVPTKKFECESAEIEMTKQVAGDTTYIRLYEKLVAALAPRVVEIFTSYVQKTACAFGEIRRGLRDSSQKLVPYRGPSKVLPKHNNGIDCYIQVDNQPQRVSKRERDATLLVSPATLSVPTLPALLHANNDVRSTNGTTGLQVHHDDQGGDERFKLLPLRTEERDEPLAGGDKR